jgi:YegS/Rv2252/BmrU family lipid kinase
MKRKIRFIINPVSGTRSKKHVQELIPQVLKEKRWEVEVVHTERAGHATELAREAVEQGCYAVVAVGGDGTVNEVGQGLIGTKTALGIVPCGSGNGLARHVHIPLNVADALAIIDEGFVKRVDYGLINTAPFFCTCGVGFDALVSLRFHEQGRRGLFTYLEKALREFLQYRPETYELQTPDGTHSYKAFLLTCCNASQYGNGAFISPQASIQDGLLDVTVLQPFTVFDIPVLVFQLFNRMINQNSRIKTFQCSELVIRRSKAGVAHADGDPVQMEADIRVSLVAGGLRVLCPRKVVLPFDARTAVVGNIEFLKSLFRR